MSHRLPGGGRLTDSARPISFTFNGRRMRGLAGDTLASALLANGQVLMGRSFKYHRPRGVVASGVEEPNALMGIGRGGHFEPNQRATMTELHDGLEARSQNHWPSLDFDVGAINALASRLLPAGFYYKTFIHPRAAWKHLFEPVIRASAGLGAAPKDRDADTYEHAYAHVDVLVAGGGVAGLAAALAAGRAGQRVMLVEQQGHWGGRTAVDGGEIDGKPAETWINDAVQELEGMGNVTLRTRCVAAGVYDHGYVTCNERLTDHAPHDPALQGAPRHRLWRVRAGRIVNAAGALERPLAFPGNDRPGVMLASAIRDYLVNWGVAAGQRTVIVTNNDDAYRTALALVEAGLDVPLIVEARANATGPNAAAARAAGIAVAEGAAVIGTTGGRNGVTGLTLRRADGREEHVTCDAVGMSGGFSPVVHLWSHCGGKLAWDEAQAHFRPDPDHPPRGADGTGMVLCAGAADGAGSLADVLESGHAAGCRAVAETGGTAPDGPAPKAAQAEIPAIAPVWIMPADAGAEKREKMWLDFQNDVKVSDVQLAAQEGYQSVEHAKRYTTLGMATDQGKLSNINGLAVLADALGEPIPQVGTTTFRPPYTPLTMGAIAGEARGPLFQPVRETPIHAWHVENGAHMEPVGLWRRPYCYPRKGESHRNAVNREVLNTRGNVGLLDASTLGKILVSGPDAGRFLDMLYTNVMSSLPVGRCRYGLMCNENGFLMDDGVVVRLDEHTWLCHTTSGGADRIHGWMEDWLQCEWWDWQVHTLNLTEQYAQIAVVGPTSRALLEKLGGDIDLSREAFRFMDWREGMLGGIAARVFRISFSGELSYEVAVPASRGRAFWDACLAAGEALSVQPYGTEALHVMRAEKGFIMIGDETDGTVIPQDLRLDWAISKKKDDYLGKAAQARAHMVAPDRWKLVGLECDDGAVLPEGAYVTAPGRNDLGQNRMIGRVTSTYHSPTLGRGIAMALVERGPERMGEVLDVPGEGGRVHRAKIVEPVFYDREGTKADV